MTAPAARSLATRGASPAATFPLRRLLPHSQGKPATSIELLTEIGTPCRGPIEFDFALEQMEASADLAWVRARSLSTVTNAFNFGFNSWIRERCASTNSNGEIFFARIFCAMSVSER